MNEEIRFHSDNVVCRTVLDRIAVTVKSTFLSRKLYSIFQDGSIQKQHISSAIFSIWLSLIAVAMILPLPVSAMTISAPSIAENSGVVPVSISSIGPQLAQGDTATISEASLANPVMSVSVTSSVTLDSFSTRIRIPDAGYVTIGGDVLRSDGTSEHADQQIGVTIPDSPPTDGSGWSGTKWRGGVGSIQMLLTDDQALDNYAKQVVVTLPGQGTIVADLTPWISQNPFLEFTGNFDATNASISVISSVPIPSAAYLFGSGLLTLIGMSRRKAKQERA